VFAEETQTTFISHLKRIWIFVPITFDVTKTFYIIFEEKTSSVNFLQQVIQPQKKTFSLPSKAFQLRKKLLSGLPLQKLLVMDEEHRKFLVQQGKNIRRRRLTQGEKFAWQFLEDLDILKTGLRCKEFIPAKGVSHDLQHVIDQVQKIWFQDMETPVNVCWLNRYSTRKLAHYSPTKDEIAFSLIFDLNEAPPDILNYLAYHELLHRKIGINKIGDRRYAHTPEFKAREKWFPNWMEMDQRINQYIYQK